MATHSSTLAWKIPWMEEPGRLQSMGSLSQTRLKRLSSSSRKEDREDVSLFFFFPPVPTMEHSLPFP